MKFGSKNIIVAALVLVIVGAVTVLVSKKMDKARPVNGEMVQQNIVKQVSEMPTVDIGEPLRPNMKKLMEQMASGGVPLPASMGGMDLNKEDRMQLAKFILAWPDSDSVRRNQLFTTYARNAKDKSDISLFNAIFSQTKSNVAAQTKNPMEAPLWNVAVNTSRIMLFIPTIPAPIKDAVRSSLIEAQKSQNKELARIAEEILRTSKAHSQK